MIKDTLTLLFRFLKNPILVKEESSTKTQLRIFIHLLITCIVVGVLTTPIFVIVESLGIVNMQDHKVEALFKEMHPLQIILIGGLIVPIIEELIFRGPITLFKTPKGFRAAFYFFTFMFGFIHITNFGITATVLLLSPLLVLPQLFVGLALGYIRVKQGLLWSIALHAVYNSIFLGISLLSESFS